MFVNTPRAARGRCDVITVTSSQPPGGRGVFGQCTPPPPPPNKGGGERNRKEGLHILIKEKAAKRSLFSDVFRSLMDFLNANFCGAELLHLRK